VESHLLIDDENSSLNNIEQMTEAHEQNIATALLQGAIARRYATLWSNLANQQSRGNYQYPVELTEAYIVLANYHPHSQVQSQQQQHPNARNTPTTNSPSVTTAIGPQTLAQTTRATSASSFTKVLGNDGVTELDVP
jgi:hypothetical protein